MTDSRESILVVTTSYPRGPGDAAGHFVEAEVRTLRAQGHRVTVLVAGEPPTRDGVIGLGGAALFDHPGALVRLQQAPWRALSLAVPTAAVYEFRRSHPHFDRIICHWLIPSAFPWGHLVRRSRAPIEGVAHGSDVRMLLKWPEPIRNYFLERLRRMSCQLRFVSKALKEDLLQGLKRPKLRAYVDAAHVGPSPIDCSQAPTRAEARQQLGLDPDATWAVVVGRLISSKRPEVALSAAELVPQLRVAIVGDGPLRQSLQRRHPDVRFLGKLPRDETLQWIAAADLLLAPSRQEGAPTSIREARQLGTCVVTVGCGDVSEWAKSDVDLWVVD